MRQEPEIRTVQVPLTMAGMPVDHDRALTYSAVYASVRIIAENIAMLPWHVFRRLPNGGREKVDTGSVRFVLNQEPNSEMTPFTWRATTSGRWG